MTAVCKCQMHVVGIFGSTKELATPSENLIAYLHCNIAPIYSTSKVLKRALLQ
jgi:hypothetical protein